MKANPFHETPTNRKPYSSFRVKNHLFTLGLKHALHDAAHGLVPVAIVCAAVAFLIWFWGNGPTDLVKDLFGFNLGNLMVAKILSIFIVGFPTVVFAKSAFFNFLTVLSDPRAVQRDMDLAWDRIFRLDAELKEAQK